MTSKRNIRLIGGPLAGGDFRPSLDFKGSLPLVDKDGTVGTYNPYGKWEPVKPVEVKEAA